ncbi:hypothetical protein SARC_06557 [Sphaeroforma arctica JP610]|uniref:THIF-type NAD/FAD binding fold domain-containing protein n=1 Tax=Sphaeroforma arctica JP610 TaxID=667725 RepID=A0A0L0FYT6_9EUKA|nr:hypothetical protein SARC_06557 [Sphaeroforma arctica JP610]KNC81108.1 hypothetical protein SARC_06557 [Sphaeroforma arctica JP610]|eukprot:XP_014155010.1 hypothetical protein SARC_06557 [Sphaeroforma arctica JP610]
MSVEDAALNVILGVDNTKLIKDAKVLVVGAGGIGCELLKSLVMAGFMNLEVIDLDTIDVSNLNRQFLFRKEHVGKSKSLVACETIQAFKTGIYVKSHHADVKGEMFNIDYFKG